MATTNSLDGVILPPSQGGTGVSNNDSSTITVTGSYPLAFTVTAPTTITAPTSGTLATTSNKLSDFAATSSSELHGVISDETGTGNLVFSTSPNLTTPNIGVADTTMLKFNTSPTVGSFQEGKMYYDNVYKTISCNIDTDVNLQLGQEIQTRVVNTSGTDILNGQVIYSSGASGIFPSVGLAISTSVSTSFAIAVATQDISNGAEGIVTIIGMVNDLNTSSWNSGDVLYVSDTTPGGLTNVPPNPPSVRAIVGRVVVKDATVGSIYVNPRPLNQLTNLSDVNITDPEIDSVLRYNGSVWVNGSPATSSASTGIDFFEDDTDIIPLSTNNVIEVNSLSKTPITATPEVVDSANVTVANSPLCTEAYLYNTALGRTTIDAGVWTFNTYASVSSIGGGRISSISRSVYVVIAGSGTLTTTGTGTTRTATITGGTPFISGDVGANASVAGYLQTPHGLYRISAYTSSSVVSITVPSTYANESGVAYSKWKYLFQANTGTITSLTTNYSLYTTDSTQPAFTVNLTDKLAEMIFCISNNTTTVNWTHNGTAHYSSFKTPLITLHNNLAGLQGGTSNEMYHATSAEYTGTGTGVFARKDSPEFSTLIKTPTVNVGVASSSAYVHIKAGTTAAGTAPLKFTSGSLNTSPEQGAIEYDGTKLYYTGSSSIRQDLAPAAYGYLYYDDMNTPLVITTTVAGTYYPVASNGTQNLTASTSTELRLLTPDVTSGNGKFTVATGGAGMYQIEYSVSYSSAQNDQTNIGYVKVNSTQLHQITSASKVKNASSVFNSGRSGLARLADGDVVSFEVTSDVAGGTLSIVKYSFCLTRVGR